jgi:hypothetical protein
VRFEVEASPRATLLAEIERVGPFAIVVPVTDENDTRTLYGVVLATYRAGQWSGSANIENPVAGLGAPDYAFDVPVLLSGSEEAEAALEAMTERSVAAAEQRLAEELARLRAEQDRRIAEMELAVERRSAELAREIEIIEAENLRVLATLEGQHAARMAQLLNEHGAAVRGEEETYQREITRIQAEATAEISRIQNAADMEIQQARAAAEARVDALVAELRQTEEERVLQEQIIATQRQLLENSRVLDALAAEGLDRRSEVTADLAGRWTGRVDCSTSFLPWYTFTATYADDGSGALTGHLTVTAEATSRFADQVGTPLPSTMTLLSQVGEPIVLGLGTQGRIRNGLLDISVQQQPDGSYAGTAGDESQCAVRLAR